MFHFISADARVGGGDGRRGFRHVPVLQDPDLEGSHRREETLRSDHTPRGDHANGLVHYDL